MFLYIFSFCSCDEPEIKANLNDDTFPSSDQIWGMIGTILATVACWFVYTKVPNQKHCLPLPPLTIYLYYYASVACGSHVLSYINPKSLFIVVKISEKVVHTECKTNTLNAFLLIC